MPRFDARRAPWRAPVVAGDASTAQNAPRCGNRDRDARAGAARVRRRTLPSQVDAGVTHEAAGIILFKHIFRIAPQALPLFSFGRVEGTEVNDALFDDASLYSRRWRAAWVLLGSAPRLEAGDPVPAQQRSAEQRSAQQRSAEQRSAQQRSAQQRSAQ